MVTEVQTFETSTYNLCPEINWAEQYPNILSTARRFVYMYQIPRWHGQEEDMAEDVAQETIRRTIVHLSKAAQGEVTPIASLEHLMVVIARNYVLDLRRHEYRIVRIPSDNCTSEICAHENDLLSMPEAATENVYREWLFLLLAHEIANFPCKQRRAILIDLSNLMRFDRQPTALQAAFLAAGIDLQAYQQALPENHVERARHASLLSQAYKRLAQLDLVRRYVLAA